MEMHPANTARINLLTSIPGRAEHRLVPQARGASFRDVRRQVGDVWNITSVEACVLSYSCTLLRSNIIIATQDEWTHLLCQNFYRDPRDPTPVISLMLHKKTEAPSDNELDVRSQLVPAAQLTPPPTPPIKGEVEGSLRHAFAASKPANDAQAAELTKLKAASALQAEQLAERIVELEKLKAANAAQSQQLVESTAEQTRLKEIEETLSEKVSKHICLHRVTLGQMEELESVSKLETEAYEGLKSLHTKLKADNKVKASELVQLKADNEAKTLELLRLKADNDVKTLELTRLKADNDVKIKELAEFKASHATEIQQLKASHATKNQQLKASHTTEMEQLKASHLAEMEKLKASHAADSKASPSSEVEQSPRDYAALSAGFGQYPRSSCVWGRGSGILDSVANLRSSNASLSDSLRRSNAKHGDLSSEVKALKTELAQVKADKELLLAAPDPTTARNRQLELEVAAWKVTRDAEAQRLDDYRRSQKASLDYARNNATTADQVLLLTLAKLDQLDKFLGYDPAPPVQPQPAPVTTPGRGAKRRR